MDQQEQIATIQRKQAEVRAFVDEQDRLIDRDNARGVWPIALGAMVVGAALFGAGAAFVRFFGS